MKILTKSKTLKRVLAAGMISGVALFALPSCATEGPNEKTGEAKDEYNKKVHEAQEEYHEEMEDVYGD